MEKNTSETLYSLKFAERVRSVELGPGSRRAELVSWSSQEHLEVWGPPQACLRPVLGHRHPGHGQEGGFGGEDSVEWWRRGRYQRGWSQNLNPNPVASLVQVFFLGLRGTCGGHQLVGGGTGAGAGWHTGAQ